MTDHDHDHDHDPNHEHDDACGCGHDHGDDDMVEIVYTAREDVLEAEGISPEEFSDALDKAIDALEALAMREDVPDEDIPAMEDLKLTIKGKEYRLGELAEVSFEGDLDEEDFDDEDEEGADEGEEAEVQED
ncbi:MAG: hypothetical protein BGO49_14345 [Planctomycetales bacterium 71-10]|nr:MAG: hypothetical protein BGO49_14345 [Planctomycetales bacterium 71-10]